MNGVVLAGGNESRRGGRASVLVDTHAHLDAWPEAPALDAMLTRAAAAGVGGVVAIGGDPARNAVAVQAARVRPDRVVAAVGLDRDCATSPELEAALAELSTGTPPPCVVAVGEVGLDFHYGADSAAAQQALFARMAALARDWSLPLVVHSREAEAATLAALEAHASARGGTDRIGVLHCFTGDADFAARLVELGLFISFSGILTFRRADALRAAAAAVPEDRLLIETDTPYLAPVPFRGCPNEPALLVHTAAALAALRGCTPEEIAALTSRNAQRLFGSIPAGDVRDEPGDREPTPPA